MFKANFTQQDFKKSIEQRLILIEQRTVARLQKYGEELVNYAKETRSFKDQTGNLINSFGYALIKDGKILNAAFGSDGEALSRKMASDTARKMPKGYALIVVAGMNYAAQVEAKNFVVLTMSELKAKSEFPALVRQLIGKK